MTSILAAALVAAWAAIVLLFLGYSALLGQIRELKSGQPTGGGVSHPELAAPSAVSRTVALVVGSGCATCAEVLPAWLTLAPQLADAGHRPVLLSIDNSTGWAEHGAETFMLGSELSAPLLLAYQPALLLFDESGAIVSAEPVGSALGLQEYCAPLLGLVSS
ncbi:hypothetical protein AB0C50_07610 [Micromonospora taraxaci]|uniref:hypothetical protein n=1 Tax=Micromonospora taraxaci TaxID=1316803 RepID=UPI00340FE5E0